MSVKRSARIRNLKEKIEPSLSIVIKRAEIRVDDLIVENPRLLRPRQEKNYKYNSLNGTLDEDERDKDYSTKSDTETDSDSDSDFFSTKKRKLNSTRIDNSSLLQVFENIDPTEEENEYRRQRQQNMLDRFKVLDSLDFDSDVKELKAITPIRKAEAPKKVAKPQRPASKSSTPREPIKRSLRLQNRSLNITMDNELELQFGSFTTDRKEAYERTRITDEQVNIVDEGSDEQMIEVMNTLKNDVNLSYEETNTISTCDYDKYVDIVKSCRLQYEPFKVIKQRIVSMDFHPSSKKLIVIAGDKIGHMAIQDLVKQDTNIEFQTHAFNVNCVSFSREDHTKFFSTSLEGCTRQGDINSSKSILVHQSDPDQHTTWHHEFGQSLFIAEGSGIVKLVDLRTPGEKSSSFQCHSRSVRNVMLHPTNDNYFLTSSGTGEFGIFDIRTSSSKKPNPVILQTFNKGLTSAFISAKGNYVVSTCNDDTIRVHDVSNLQTSTKVSKVTHNNHTGRWLSVFKANWHPGREDAYIVGSMLSDPKRIQYYHRDGHMIHQFSDDLMTTFSPVITVHPTEPVFVGGTGSGKFHVFSPVNLDEIYS